MEVGKKETVIHLSGKQDSDNFSKKKEKLSLAFLLVQGI